ncbi:MAG: hypothetical protein KDE33_28050 [Bacteroidetes bacterium]|nr:hypothetical protein [Bacteroidota bacterium]
MDRTNKFLLKIGLIIVFVLFLFLLSTVWYNNYSSKEALKKKEIKGVISKIKKGKRGLRYYKINNKFEYLEGYELVIGSLLQVNDSIVKERNTTKIIIYRKYNGKYEKIKEYSL